MNNSKIQEIIANSEQNFKSFDGLGGNKQEFLSADGAGAGSVAKINYGVKPMVIDIFNSDDSYTLAAPLFSANEELEVPFNGVLDQFTKNTAQVGKGIIVKPQDYSFNELRRLAANDGAYILQGIRYIHGDASQLQESWGFRYKDGSQICEDKYRPNLYKNLANQVTDTIDSEEFFMAVDAKATLFIPVLKATGSVQRKIQVTFRIASQTNMLNLLKGGSILEINRMNVR